MRDILIFVVGVLGGMSAMALAYQHSFRLASSLQRTGKPDAPPVPETGGRISANPEASAQRAVTEDTISNGADQIMAAAKAEGVSMTRREAERHAREMAQAMDPLGGAH